MKIFNDGWMRFDELSGQWVLTEQALIDYGINLRARLASRKAVSPELLVDRLLTTVSEMLYGYIYSQSAHNDSQDEILAANDSAKMLLYRALIQQAIHVLNVGNLTYSVNAEERAAAINDVSKQILGRKIPGLEYSILSAEGD